MTSTLQKLLDAGLVQTHDEIGFHFKGHNFAARLVEGGLVTHCTWNQQPALQDKVAFTTLTDWCDTCIQELVDEYVTRFSSWKRVRHVPTGTSLAQIRAKLTETPVHEQCNCMQLQTARKQIVALELKVQELNRLLRGKRMPDKLEDDNPFRLKF